MKFIFPQNYNFSAKLFGILDYSTAILNIIWAVIIFLISNIFFKRLTFKLGFCIIFVSPVVIFSIVGVQGENFVHFLQYLIKYILSPKIYLYK